MKQAFSTKWKSSKAPAKQRKYRYNAPLHISRKFLAAHLSPELRKKHSTRSFTLVKGDKVKVLRGQFKGRENKVERVDHKELKIYVTGVDRAKKDGSKSMYPLNPTNLMITELELSDKKRKASLERKGGKIQSKPAASAEKLNKGN
ncbi:MAG: 50S ribosomal protein L24 [Candidatus Woesearchaeota archaeon]